MNIFTNVYLYVDFSDSSSILLKNNPFIKDNIYNLIKQLREKLNEIAPIRTRVMHSRPLLLGNFSPVYAFVCEIDN